MSLRSVASILGSVILAGMIVLAQQSPERRAEPVAPIISDAPSSEVGGFRLMRFNGALKAHAGKALPGVVGITISIYESQQGGAPLWAETQNAQLDAQGNYSV